jgi:hypothetical protein
MCKNWREKGQCRYGDKCLFAHGTDELTKTSQTASSTCDTGIQDDEKKFQTPKKVSCFEQEGSDSTRATGNQLQTTEDKKE